MRILQSKAEIVALSGELSEDLADHFEAALDPVRDCKGDVPVIDLSEVTALSSKCLGVLVALWVDLKKRKRFFELRAPDAIWREMQAAGVGRVFLTRDDFPSAAGRDGQPKRLSKRAKPAQAESVLAARSLKSIEVEIERYVTKIAELNEQLETAGSKVEARVAERDKLFAELRSRNADMAKLREETASAITEVRTQMAAMRNSRDEVATELVRLKKEYKSFRKDAEGNEKLAGTAGELEEEAAAARAEVARLEGCLSSEEDALSQMRNGLAAAVAEYGESQEELKALRAESEARQETASRKAMDLTDENDRLQSELARLQARVASLEATATRQPTAAKAPRSTLKARPKVKPQPKPVPKRPASSKRRRSSSPSKPTRSAKSKRSARPSAHAKKQAVKSAKKPARSKAQSASKKKRR